MFQAYYADRVPAGLGVVPSGAPLASATVQADGTLTFTLGAGSYVAFSSAQTIRFNVDPVPSVYAALSTDAADAGKALDARGGPPVSVGTGEVGQGAITPTAGRLSTVRNPALRDFVTARDFDVQGNGTSDDTTGLLAATEAARNSGKALIVPAGKYKVSARIVVLGNTNPLVLRGDGPGLTEFQMAASFVPPVIEGTGVLGAAVAVTAAASPGASGLTVASTTGITEGQYVRLIDPDQPFNGSANVVICYASEWVRVLAVTSTTTLTFYNRLEYGYGLNATVRKLTPCGKLDLAQFSIRNMFPGTQAATARGISATYFNGLRIRDVDMRDMDATCVQAGRGVNVLAKDMEFLDTHDIERPPLYCFQTSSTQNVLASGLRARYGRHVTDAGGDTTYGLASHMHFSGCVATDMTASGFGSHHGVRHVTYNDCHVFGSRDVADPYETSGFQIRSIDTEIVGCTVDNVTDHGVYVPYNADRCRVVGGRFSRCDIGVEIDGSQDCFIGGDALIEAPRVAGVRFTRGAAYAAAMTRVGLGDLAITGNPLVAAIDNTVTGLEVAYR